jgi:hypothetical protein
MLESAEELQSTPTQSTFTRTTDSALTIIKEDLNHTCLYSKITTT